MIARLPSDPRYRAAMRTASLSLCLALACAPDRGAAARESGAATADTGVDPACLAPDLPTWQDWGEGFFVTWCQSCHSRSTPQRAGAPEGVDFDTRADVRAAASAIRRTVLDDASMPVGGGVPEDDRVALDLLLRCGP